MWLDRYNSMSSIDKERFSELTNELLNRNYILAYHYDNKNRSRRPNSNYNFIVKYYEVFEAYFAMANYVLKRDDDYHVISLTNEAGYNHERIDKLTTIFLFTLRLMYDEEKEKASTSEVVYTTTAQVIYKMMELELITKKPTIKDTVDALRFAINHNIITRLDKTIDNMGAQIVILPTILFTISNEKINAIFQIMFNRNTENNEEAVEA